MAVQALSSYWKFLELLDFKGGIKNFGSIHKELAEFVSSAQFDYIAKEGVPEKRMSGDERRRLILIPRGHLKSTLCSVGYVLWRIWRNPNIRIAVCTATKDLALSFIREVKQYLEDEDLQERVWNNRPHIQGRMIPVLDKVAARRRDRLRWEDDEAFTEATDKKVVWRADAIQVMRSQIMREPTIIASSPGGNITGMHFDIVVDDDIINDDTVATQAKIDKTMTWAQDLESVIDPQRMVKMGTVENKHYYEVVGDEVVILGTRYARHDYYGYILDNLDLLQYSVFQRNVYKNGKDATDGYLWAEKFNEEVLDRIKRRQGARRFASQYLNQIMAEEDIVLKPDQIQYIHYVDLTIKDGFVEWKSTDKHGITRHNRVKTVIMVDPAISEKKNADYSVLTVGGQDADRNLYIFDIIFGRFPPDKLVDNLYKLVDKWQCKVAHIETVSFQQSLIYIIRNSFKKYKPIVLNEYRPKGEKKARITTYLEPLFSNYCIYIEKRLGGITELMEEITYFPQATIKDDIIDTFAMIAEVTTPTAKKQTKRNVVSITTATNWKYGGIR